MRKSSIEVLRFFFMFLIVLQDVFVHGLHYQNDTYSTYPCLNILLLSFSYVGVTGFMFISGYYGIRFKLNSLISLFNQVLFWSVIIACFVYYI